MTGIRSTIHGLYVRLPVLQGVGRRISRTLCWAGWHSAKWLPPMPDRLEVVCRRCNLLLERVYLPNPKPPRSDEDSAVPAPADPPPSVPKAPRAPAGGDTPGTFSGGGR